MERQMKSLGRSDSCSNVLPKSGLLQGVIAKTKSREPVSMILFIKIRIYYWLKYLYRIYLTWFDLFF